MNEEIEEYLEYKCISLICTRENKVCIPKETRRIDSIHIWSPD